MSPATILILLFGALAGGFVSGLAGFGTALIAIGIWLYVLPPPIAATLVIICSVASQSWTMPSIWRAIDFKLIWPFLVGGLIGAPLGTLLVAQVDPGAFKLGVGVLLIVFPTALFLNRRPMAFTFGGRYADGVIGLAGGIMGGLSGLSGPLPTLWASVRGWGKDERRGVFQTFNWTVLVAALVTHVGAGLISQPVIGLALLALPGTLIGAWLGARAYHRLSDHHFHRVVLGLLFASGVSLVVSQIGPPTAAILATHPGAPAPSGRHLPR